MGGEGDWPRSPETRQAQEPRANQSMLAQVALWQWVKGEEIQSGAPVPPDLCNWHDLALGRNPP